MLDERFMSQTNPVNPLETNPEKLSSQPWKSLIVVFVDCSLFVSDGLDSLIGLSGLLLVISPHLLFVVPVSV
jgi:hypothetical protein